MEALRRRSSDGELLRLIYRWLKAGYVLEGRHFPTDQGSPQGGSSPRCSPTSTSTSSTSSSSSRTRLWGGWSATRATSSSNAVTPNTQPARQRGQRRGCAGGGCG